MFVAFFFFVLLVVPPLLVSLLLLLLLRPPLSPRLNRSYYRGTDGCLLVFDITDRASFEALPRWLDEARTNSANPDLSVMLIANKADLAEK